MRKTFRKQRTNGRRNVWTREGKKWSDKGINIVTQDLRITIGEKKFDCDLSYTFEDAENEVIWTGFNLEVDLSEHMSELKTLIIKAMIDKFFK